MASDRDESDFAAQSRRVVEAVDELLKPKVPYATPEDFLRAKTAAGLDNLHRAWTERYVALTAPDAPDNEEKVEAYVIAKETVLPKLRELTTFFLTLRASPTANGGKRKWKMPRKMSRTYCKKTPCRKMGFTQRSSCRPYKNCFTRRARRSG